MGLTLGSNIRELVLAIGEIIINSDGKITTAELEIPGQLFYLEIAVKLKEVQDDTDKKARKDESK